MHSKKLIAGFVFLFAFSGEAPARTIGPDTFGYSATDAVPFAFEDIASTGTLTLAGTDDGVFTAPLGFTFSFYGTSWTSVSWSTNGLISFGGTNSQFSNGNLAVTRVIGDRPSIAVLWDDWQFLAGVSQGCYYETRGAPGSRRFILQWTGALGFEPTSQTVTYQAILFEGSNAIVMQYLDVDSGDLGSFGALATVGIRDTNGQVTGRNLVWSFNSAALSNGMALRFQTASVDVDPPVVSIVSPLNGSVVSAPSVLVTANVSDAGSTTVTSLPAGISGSLPSGGGTVAGSVALAEGPNTITVNVVDGSGNAAATSITVHRDSVAPSILSVSPADGSVVGLPDVNFVVEVSDTFPVILSVAGLVQTLPAGGGLAMVPVILAEGENVVFVSATDTAGNNTALVVRVVLDSNAPVISIDTPVDGSVVGPDGSPAPVLVTVNDTTAITVSSSPDGVSGSVPAGGGVLAGAVALVEGTNQIVITATDAFGRSATASVTVVLDSIPPAISLESPPDGAAVRGTIDLAASAQDPAPGSGVAEMGFSVDGATVSTSDSSPFVSPLNTTELADGMHAVTATAVDAVGNAASESVRVHVDNTLPTLAFSSPEDGAQVSGTFAFELAASDAMSGVVSVEVLANGAAPTDAPPGAQDMPVPTLVFSGQEDSTRWPDGELRLSAKVTDAAGNEASTSIVVRVSNSVPATVVISPADGSRVSGVIQIGVEVSGPEVALVELFVDGSLLGSSGSAPFAVSFDTTSRLDGSMSITAVVADAGGSTWSGSSTVVVDNMVMEIHPTVLNLKSQGDCVKVLVTGSGSELLLAPGRRMELRVPGGTSVPAAGARAGEGGVIVPFDRAALASSLRAAISTGAIPADSPVALVLAADGLEIGSALVLPRDNCR